MTLNRRTMIAASTFCSFNALCFGEFYTPSEDLKRLKKQVIPHDPNLPNVLLIGDSISIAYTPFVIDMLKGKANVSRAKGNCGSTEKGIGSTKNWIGEKRWDVIHFNFGLHDLCYRHPDAKVYGNRDKINGTQSVTTMDYAKNLENIVSQLKKTDATLIFANTTKVPEGEAGRVVGDDVKYNLVAEKVMKRNNIAINNLHQLTDSFSANLFIRPGDVHFTPDGSYKIAQQVVKSIEAELK